MGIIRDKVSETANIIFGTCYDPTLEGSINVSIIIGGIKTDTIAPPVGHVEIPLAQHVAPQVVKIHICNIFRQLY